MNNTMIKILALSLAATGLSNSTFASEDDSWFLRPYLGLSQVSNFEATANNVDGLTGPAKIDLDTGYVTGIGIGYRYNENIAVELAWEYRSNDADVLVADQSLLSNGNYASNIFFINGHYHFNRQDNWQPYVGVGLSWVQEIDIDFERNGIESSYSSDGDTGYQLFAGVDYQLAPALALQTELRYGSITGIDLQQEEGNAGGNFSNLDYKPFTLQAGIVYQF